MTATATRPGTQDPVALAVAMLKNNMPAATVAADTGLSFGEVVAAAEAAGITRTPDLTALGKEMAEALEWGRRHDSKKVRALADRARAALNDLARLRRNESVATEAETEIARLRKQLAAAEDKLRAATGKTPSPTAAYSKAQRDEIRQWARLNGHTVGDHGIIPAAVIQAWQNAHRSR
ncbi:Lsr2 family DNA-binding protein [Streptomyces sp. H39-C1]|uniref:Lsr2 family DNA-binding protein n=1 Tax=Streptomyces sp. H39-C1 TaxID=3004355 RepID=UPI0022AF3772|nr:histone-like nucleoid-structuring protein Lsr2 [Streptomyces sp. H39-C1]MCZ4102645.1 Lsr2 family protein [Streptomyces sp. H39-C1]